MDKHTPKFIPDLVDDQLDQFLARRLPTSPDERIVSDLHQMYQGDERSLMKVWRRLGLENEQSETLSTAFTVPQPASAKILNLKRKRHMYETRKNPLARSLSLLAVACVAALIVGGILVISNLAHQGQYTHTTEPGTTQQHQTNSNLPQGVYASSTKGLFRLNSQTHQVFWQQSLANITKIVPAGNTVYVLQSNQSPRGTNAVVALNANTGQALWTRFFSAQGYGNDTIFAQTTDLVLAQNQLYVGWQIWDQTSKATTGHVYILNVSDGSQRAVYSTTASTFSLAVGDSVLAVSADSSLQVYDATSGKSLWHISIQGPSNQLVYSLSIVNNLIYAIFSTNDETSGEGQSYIAIYRANTGDLVWKSPVFPGDALSHFTVDQNIVYFGTLHLTTQQKDWTGKVYAYDIQSNKQLWSQPINGAVQSTPVINNGVVYVAADNDTKGHARIIALSAATGAIKWQQLLANGFADNFCVSNGIVYTVNPNYLVKASKPDELYALNAANGNTLWEITQLGSASQSSSQPGAAINVVPTS